MNRHPMLRVEIEKNKYLKLQVEDKARAMEGKIMSKMKNLERRSKECVKFEAEKLDTLVGNCSETVRRLLEE